MRAYLVLLLFGLLNLYACKTINFAKECSERFPPRTDTVKITTLTIKNDTFYIPVTKATQVVNTVCPPNKDTIIISKEIVVNCPPQETIIKTQFKHDSIIVHLANVAKETVLLQQLDSFNEIIKAKNRTIETKNYWLKAFRWATLIGWLIIFAYAYFSFHIWMVNRR